MSIIEISDYYLPPYGLGNGLKADSFTVKKGEVWKIETDNINDAHLLMSGLATLSYPEKGLFLFEKKALDFRDYRKLLPAKKKIGYLSSDSTLISNRTIRENLTLHKVYSDNNLSPEFNEYTLKICDRFGISQVLDVRPANLKPPDIKKAILVREILKNPVLVLIEHPEEFSGYNAMDELIDKLKNLVSSGLALIYLSYNDKFIQAFAHKTLSISKGTLKAISGA